MIILIEGADSAGKTTLANALRARHDARYFHSTVRNGIWRWHVAAVRAAARDPRPFILDRLWLSEQVYGSIFRGQPEYDVGARVLDRVLRRFGALTILCVPSDLEEQERRWLRNRAAGKHEHFDSVRNVIAAYADLRHGNVACPGNTYLAQLTRAGTYAARDDVMVYDMDLHLNTRTFNGFLKEVDLRLSRLRRRTPDRYLDYQYENVSGRISGGQRLLFVGEGPGRGSAPLPSWPWCGNEHNFDASSWFNAAVHRLALDESGMAFMNVQFRDGTVDPHLDQMIWEADAKRVIALGRIADKELTRLGIDHQAVVHPQYHKRFMSKTSYSELLEAVI